MNKNRPIEDVLWMSIFKARSAIKHAENTVKNILEIKNSKNILKSSVHLMKSLSYLDKEEKHVIEYMSKISEDSL